MCAAPLAAIAEKDGPRCCKRNTWLALGSVSKLFTGELGVALERHDATRCAHGHRNRECIRKRCPYWDGGTRG